jgi:hypothetical protein
MGLKTYKLKNAPADTLFYVIKTSDGYYRFINNDLAILTTGFRSRKILVQKYKDDISFRPEALAIMKNRYIKNANGTTDLK